MFIHSFVFCCFFHSFIRSFGCLTAAIIKAPTHTYTFDSVCLSHSLRVSVCECAHSFSYFFIVFLPVPHYSLCGSHMVLFSLFRSFVLYHSSTLCVRRPQLINKLCAVAYTHRPNIHQPAHLCAAHWKFGRLSLVECFVEFIHKTEGNTKSLTPNNKIIIKRRHFVRLKLGKAIN